MARTGSTVRSSMPSSSCCWCHFLMPSASRFSPWWLVSASPGRVRKQRARARKAQTPSWIRGCGLKLPISLAGRSRTRPSPEPRGASSQDACWKTTLLSRSRPPTLPGWVHLTCRLFVVMTRMGLLSTRPASVSSLRLSIVRRCPRSVWCDQILRGALRQPCKWVMRVMLTRSPQAAWFCREDPAARSSLWLPAWKVANGGKMATGLSSTCRKTYQVLS
mmetsp:Transcript_18376/g.43097  ORF Transcript_18376/g.43097 Transcript_18376/m.43097 type:complete len:219 (-) Transcript_18376:925-1581(-)